MSPYEQNTQQSPGLGRMRVPHSTQSWMYTHALTGMTSSVSARHTGQRSRAVRIMHPPFFYHGKSRGYRCRVTHSRSEGSPGVVTGAPAVRPQA